MKKQTEKRARDAKLVQVADGEMEDANCDLKHGTREAPQV